MYALDKPIQFQTQRWFDILKENSGNEVKSVSQGHWIMLNH